ncbi:hypothetical protein LOK74_14305 [Brevibacillus humidisoli]|uniref:hypothetical protein n=1 Tax=Brevibacillus humidisoli TaxID=2895522 RepID=UPI001E3B6B7A|nr:hypothetical protein [Brevibacillus humidisoli]UFJ39242.1 hypothetical protein LOK74_14305 [Brevibacillus humidisoli]
MKAVETPEIKAQIKKYKKWLESATLFPYTFKWNDSEYYYVYYKRTGSRAGILILDLYAQVVSRDEAEKIAVMVGNYNSIVAEGTDKLSRDKARPIWPIQNMMALLDQLEPECSSFPSFLEIQEDWHSFRQSLQTIYTGQQRLQEIYDEMQQVDDTVHEKRNYTLTPEDVEQMRKLMREWQRTMYAEGRKQLESLPLVRRIRTFLNQHHNQVDLQVRSTVGQLLQLIKKYLDPDSLKKLRRSLSGFEKDEHGQPVTFAPGERGIEQMMKMYERRAEFDLKRVFIDGLRNE